MPECIIVGGGVIGLLTARQLFLEGVDVMWQWKSISNYINVVTNKVYLVGMYGVGYYEYYVLGLCSH